MQRISLTEALDYRESGFHKFLVHESENFKIINFNFKAGQSLPIHSHDLDGELSILVVAGRGEFLADAGVVLPAETGDVLISEIREPHGVRAITDMSILVTIAPPI